MKRLKYCLQRISFAAALVCPVAITACAVHARYYDPVYSDYHPWGPPERGYYNQWIVETHHPNIQYKRLKPDEQRNYWTWRHNHHDLHK